MSPVNIGTNPILGPSNQKIALGEENKSEATAIDHCIIKPESDENLLLDHSNSMTNEALSEPVPNAFPEQIPEIKNVFGTLLEQIWSGNWSTLKPIPFKDTLEIFHPQFRGAHQQDCQVD